ncbi:hypothetical protein BV898_18139 [Hypsibius exemplaris]|uniref:Uncharacterized protein n=1 Tax=Hypsibius exemplaris TaxID=2072580 RepID=A0A9X6NGT9_HYPEX|nr:hypothetical protein BV898_18139 [Hypsibius exemplaris]
MFHLNYFVLLVLPISSLLPLSNGQLQYYSPYSQLGGGQYAYQLQLQQQQQLYQQQLYQQKLYQQQLYQQQLRQQQLQQLALQQQQYGTSGTTYNTGTSGLYNTYTGTNPYVAGTASLSGLYANTGKVDV